MAQSHIATLITELESIRNGSGDSGRWIDQTTNEALEGENDPDLVPDDYYDVNGDPWGDKPKPDASLLPARFESYSEGEQASWLSSCESGAGRALEALEALKTERAALFDLLSEARTCIDEVWRGHAVVELLGKLDAVLTPEAES